MPFDDLLTPVAEPPVPRHDAATCCGERQGTDVGEGWRWLNDESVQLGDMVLIHPSKGDPRKECYFWAIDAEMVGVRSGPLGNFRRRVTPVAPAPQSRPAETRETTRVEQPLGACLDEENNELRQQVAMLKPEVTLLGNACEAYTAEIARLRSEVERLRLTPEERNTLERISFLLTHHNIARDAKTIALIAARQGGGE